MAIYQSLAKRTVKAEQSRHTSTLFQGEGGGGEKLCDNVVGVQTILVRIVGRVSTPAPTVGCGEGGVNTPPPDKHSVTQITKIYNFSLLTALIFRTLAA